MVFNDSAIHNNSSTSNLDSAFDTESPVDCFILHIIAYYLIGLFSLSFIFNVILIVVFYLNKDLRTPLNYFIIVIVMFNLFGTCTELPIVITSHLKCRWIFGKIGCYLSGFGMYTIGNTSIYLMTAISIERFIIIYKPLSIQNINKKVCQITVGVCIFLGAFWSILPFLGWSNYTLEGALTSCSVEWKTRTPEITSYNITIMVCIFVVPLVIMVFTNFSMLNTVRGLQKKDKLLRLRSRRNKRARMEAELTIVTMILIAGFLISWTPYAIVAMYSAFVDSNLPPLLGTVPSLFAKSSLLWTSMLYIFSNKLIRVKLFELICPCRGPIEQNFDISLQKSISKIQKDSVNNLQKKDGSSVSNPNNLSLSAARRDQQSR